jgi:uncharacterized membrane protein required for colicin V production
MLGIVVRGFYVGLKTGFVAELFRTLGIVCATFVILHYYLPVAAFLTKRMFIPQKVQESTSFTILMIAAILFSFLIREGWLIIFKVEVKSALNKWAGALCSLLTSYLVCGLFLLALILWNNGYMNQHIRSSISQPFFVKVSVRVYEAVYTALIRPFFPAEPMNIKVFHLTGRSKS